MLKINFTTWLSVLFFLLVSSEVLLKNDSSFNNNQNSNSPDEAEVIIVSDFNDSVTPQNLSHNSNESLLDVAKETALNESMSSPAIPSMSDNSSDYISKTHLEKVAIDNNSYAENSAEIPQKVVDIPVKEDTPVPITDDIPTFVEYQQMIEKESKQKREKSDSIPSSPTMILKDNHPIKGAIDATSSQVTGEHSESGLHSPAKTQETKKDEIEASHSVRKADEIKVEMTTSILSKSLMKNNVAAKECGAKILEISVQITNAGFVLNNNKDEYLNVPCSITDKWFIFETCEPVQIKSIQIANFEMFSSRPKTFKVMTADRYPVKHWYSLGLFRAHDEKGIQTFEISDTRMVKYLKFEMVDHYGNEHYCPLTFVRVMGNVVIDDMDEEPDEDQPAHGEKPESPKETPSTTDSDGLLTKAKDMIAKIVNGIGGSHKEDGVLINENDTSTSENNDTKEEDKYLVESPCYVFEFVLKNYRNYFQDIWYHFHQITRLKSLLLDVNSRSLELAIRRQPSPMQIRANYFVLLDWINKTDYSFWRLFLSFSNASSHFPRDYFVHNSIQNLSTIFKCNYDRYPSPGVYQPFLPNVTINSPSHNVPIDDSIPTVATPNVTMKNLDPETNYSDVTPPGQYEPALSGNLDVISTSSHPEIANDSNQDDTQSAIKTKVDDDAVAVAQDNKTNKATKEMKSETADYVGAENQKTTLNKYKSDEIFDNKMFANPGSNAWNYAFMRIKNIAKELEVNVSISMKYLEELSQNYKQQTDKLKKAQFVMAANVTRLENMIYKHRDETKTYIKELKVQLQAIVMLMKIGVSPDMNRKRTTSSMNQSIMDKDEDHECIDLLAEGLILPERSWLDSSAFVICLNVTLSLLCNSVLLVVFYSKMRSNILSDVTQLMMASNKHHSKQITICEPIEEVASVAERKQASLSDLRSQNPAYQVVLPPRGVHLSTFPDSDYLSDNDNMPRKHKGLGPYFYPVQPNVNFVTPTKDKKKNKRRK